MFRKTLVANRGEIAVRPFRAGREAGPGVSLADGGDLVLVVDPAEQTRAGGQLT